MQEERGDTLRGRAPQLPDSLIRRTPDEVYNVTDSSDRKPALPSGEQRPLHEKLSAAPWVRTAESLSPVPDEVP